MKMKLESLDVGDFIPEFGDGAGGRWIFSHPVRLGTWITPL